MMGNVFDGNYIEVQPYKGNNWGEGFAMKIQRWREVPP